MRTQAGRDIAGNIQQGTQGLADLSNSQGAGTSDIIGNSGVDIANVLSQSGQFDAGQIDQITAMLANLSTGTATQVGNLTQTGGNAIADSNLAATQGRQQFGADIVGALAGFSDVRLKEDIKPIGSADGINFYSWTWNDKMPIKELIGSSSEGVLAQELERSHPHLISEHDSGYKKVNYIGLSKLWQH